MKMSQEFTNLKFSVLTVIGMIISFGFLSFSIKQIQLSIAYSVWTGIGAIGFIVVGVFLVKDSINLITCVFSALFIEVVKITKIGLCLELFSYFGLYPHVFLSFI